MARASGILDMPVKEREVRIGDEIRVHAYRHFYFGVVMKVTKKYIWIKYRPMTTAAYHITKRNRAAFLLPTKYY